MVITGGTGSFGQALVRKLIDDETVTTIRVLSRDELKQEEMRRRYDSEKLRYFIGDVRDEERLISAFKDADIVIHAAALKQVPACEYNPYEAVKTNVIGSHNVISACIKNRVGTAVLLSSDKAVDPVNLYGATKLVAEKMWLAANNASPTTFMVTRWGNVMGSRGSVIPLFIEQAKRGEVTITDKRMTRFWLTLEEAVEFLWNTVGENKDGMFVPDLRSARMEDLADILCPKARKRYIGIRQGEKLHETLGPAYYSNDKSRLMNKRELGRKINELRTTKN